MAKDFSRYQCDFSRYECIASYVFEPFLAGNGPVFVLTTWDTHRRDEYRKHILAYRLSFGMGPDWTKDRVLFEGEDYHCAPGHAIDSSEAVAGLMGFLTLKPGDTDEDYFKDYTPEQLEYCAQWAEALSCEVSALYGDG
jgi:hypothetical protein